MLKVSAEMWVHNPHRATIRVVANDRLLGYLATHTEDANELVGLLNAATDLLGGCQMARDMIRIIASTHEHGNFHECDLLRYLSAPGPKGVLEFIDAAIAKTKGPTP